MARGRLAGLTCELDAAGGRCAFLPVRGDTAATISHPAAAAGLVADLTCVRVAAEARCTALPGAAVLTSAGASTLSESGPAGASSTTVSTATCSSPSLCLRE